jgi:2-polyprenyl-6-methoxyphenol hydroxylase-like FAD-dependent oxidoreductase
VIGAGPAGLASAIALTRAGVHCELVETSLHARSEGIGIALQSAPLRAAKQLGLFDGFLRVGRPHAVIDMCGADGTLFASVPQVNVNGPDDPPFLGMARESLHEVMLDEVRRLGVTIRFGTTVTRMAADESGVDVEFADGSTGRFDFVVGADGIHSTTRAAVLPDAPSPRYAGQSIWRAEAITPAGLDRYTMMIGGPVRLGLVPLPDGRLYLWMLDTTLGPERPSRDQLLPLFQERIARFAGHAPAVAEQIGTTEQLDFRALQWLLLPPPWHASRTLLVGDAAHATTPHIAFGAGLALEDAVVLGELAGGGLNFDELAAQFAARRYERARLVVETSLQLSRWEQEPGPPNPAAGRLVGETLGALAAPL